jgi:hypothetical protein
VFDKALDFGFFAAFEVFDIDIQVEGEAAEFFGGEGTADCLS